jgi:hypothetical protein
MDVDFPGNRANDLHSFFVPELHALHVRRRLGPTNHLTRQGMRARTLQPSHVGLFVKVYVSESVVDKGVSAHQKA